MKLIYAKLKLNYHRETPLSRGLKNLLYERMWCSDLVHIVDAYMASRVLMVKMRCLYKEFGKWLKSINVGCLDFQMVASL